MAVTSTGTGSAIVVWFRRDLRLSDNPAWDLACSSGRTITALFVADPRLIGPASARRVNLLYAHLEALDASLADYGGRLRVVTGDPTAVVPAIANELMAETIVWNADTTPYATRRDTMIESALGDRCERLWGTLVHPPGSVLTAKETLSRVFTPFYKRWTATPWEPWPVAAEPTAVASDPGDGLPAAAGPPPIDGGEDAANERLHEFLSVADSYPELRDIPSVSGTSYLSSDLRFGTLSPRRIATVVGESTDGRRAFVRQLAWRDWYAHMLAENPSLPDRALRPEYDTIEWVNDDDDFERWCAGATGYPIVDAGMRQLAETGWMHNRVRMIVASFLVKHLLVDWRRGERFFRHHLIDGDVAQNAGNWQWVAGTGADAAPYFRVFNPILQSRKFDVDGSYIRHWVPELAAVPAKMIHSPWEAAPLDLASAQVVLGDDYPYPIIDHAFARGRVLTTYKRALGKPV